MRKKSCVSAGHLSTSWRIHHLAPRTMIYMEMSLKGGSILREGNFGRDIKHPSPPQASRPLDPPIRARRPKNGPDTVHRAARGRRASSGRTLIRTSKGSVLLDHAGMPPGGDQHPELVASVETRHATVSTVDATVGRACWGSRVSCEEVDKRKVLMTNFISIVSTAG